MIHISGSSLWGCRITRYGISSKIASAWRKPGWNRMNNRLWGNQLSIYLKRTSFLTFKNGSTCRTRGSAWHRRWAHLKFSQLGGRHGSLVGCHAGWRCKLWRIGDGTSALLTCWSSISPTEMGRFVKQNVTAGDGEKAHGIHCRKPLKECSGLHSI